MFDPETDETDSRQPAFTPDTFAATRSLIDLILNPKDFRTCLSSLERKLAAVARAEKRSAAIIAAAEQKAAAIIAEADQRTLEADARANAASIAEGRVAELVEREQRIYALEQRWKFVGETDDLVRRGVRSPEFGTALQKARSAFGLGPERESAPDEPLPDPVNEDRHGMPFRGDLTRQPPARS
jgi:hypothetical protein